MPNPAYVKSELGKWAREGIRVAPIEEVGFLDPDSQVKILTILDAMDWPQLIIFRYDGADRVVAPFVIGVGSDGNPLMRGYQLEGVSRSGKPTGWRVFQVYKMENVEDHQDYFNASDFDFDRGYPWIYKVFKML
jgi:hypothetical protein